MINSSRLRDIEAICEQAIAAPSFAGTEILKLAVRKEHLVFHICMTIDREGGVDANLCEAISRFIERRIEELPPPVPLFSLEVASAGVARPLLRPEHYRKFAGRTINVITTLRIKNRTEFTGSIARADENAVTVDDKYAGVTPIPYAAIKRANLVYDPREDLKRKN
jgi:ribosome maturation factor RimP